MNLREETIVPTRVVQRRKKKREKETSSKLRLERFRFTVLIIFYKPQE